MILSATSFWNISIRKLNHILLSSKFNIHFDKISVEILYGRFPNTLIFSFETDFSSNFNMSSLKIVIWSLKLFLSCSANSLSFSTTKNFFGFWLNIENVRLPVPGPTSKIVLFLIFITLVIFSIIFLSIKKFWPKLF